MPEPIVEAATDIVSHIQRGEVSVGEVVDRTLTRIRDLDPALNAFSVVLGDEAVQTAAQLDRSGGGAGPLHGVPIAIKEELDVAGAVTTFGGRGNTTPAATDGEVVRRLREAGAVIVGKTHMPEFGAFPYTESVANGITRNPWDPSRTPGGSSGGTAAAIASGMVPVAIGGDGGGSIRIPAACCGLFGLKPQRGRVTNAPSEHLWWALGTVGPLSRTVRDSAVVYDVIRGSLPTDRFHAAPSDSFEAACDREPGRLRIGWSVKPVTKGVRPDPLHVATVRQQAALLADLGHDVREIDPHYPDPTPVFVPQFLAGIRAEAAGVEHYERLERRTRETYRLGGWVTPRITEWAMTQSEVLGKRVNRMFDDIDVLLTPTMAHRPPAVGMLDGRGTVAASLRALPAIAYVAIWNVAGNPAAAVPCGIGPDGLPLSVQLVGRPDDETTLISLSAQLERARPWPLIAPSP